MFIETSAKTGENIQDTFTYLLKMMSLAEQDDEFGIFQGDVLVMKHYLWAIC
jgi:hypothetical protein